MSDNEAIDRDKLGEVIASVDDHDGCHARVREWEALEQWEKDAHPDEEPFSDREDVAYWNRRADAVIAHLALSAQEAATEVEWEYTVADWGGNPDTSYFREWGNADPADASFKRVKAGPWQEVPADE